MHEGISCLSLEPIVQLQYLKQNLRIRLKHAMIPVFVASKTT